MLDIFIILCLAVAGMGIIVMFVAAFAFINNSENVAHNFWAARIAWRKGKQEYKDYIKSHK